MTFAVEPGAPTRVVSPWTIGPDPGLPVETLLADGPDRPGRGPRRGPARRRPARREGGPAKGRLLPCPRRFTEGDDRGGTRPRSTSPWRPGRSSPSASRGPRPSARRSCATWLGYDGDVPLDAGTLEAAAERLQAFLAAFGFSRARVWTEEEAVYGDGSRSGSTSTPVGCTGSATFASPARCSTTTTGCASGWRRGSPLAPEVEADQWRADLDSLAWRSGLAVPRDPVPYRTSDPEVVFNAEAWRVATQYVAEQFREDGFLEATVEVRRVSLDAATGSVDVERRGPGGGAHPGGGGRDRGQRRPRRRRTSCA